MWEEFTSVVLNRLCDLKSKCDKLPSLVSDAETATINTVPLMHICVSVLWISVFLWRFGDNKKNVLLFPTTLLYIRISFSDKLGLKFTVSQQFTSNFFRLQVLHYIFNVHLLQDCSDHPRPKKKKCYVALSRPTVKCEKTGSGFLFFFFLFFFMSDLGEEFAKFFIQWLKKALAWLVYAFWLHSARVFPI